MFEAQVKPKTIEKRAERQKKKSPTNVGKKSKTTTKTVDYVPSENSVMHPKTERGGERPGAGRPTKTTFNETNNNIEWARWTWNPVTGCRYGCTYCYAKDIAKRFYANGFEPTFHENRLSAPSNTKLTNKNPVFTEKGNQSVFVCSMADLFGDWVPAEWINAVLDEVKNNPQWTYIFLTKNPKRYLDFEFPEHCIIGATGDTDKSTRNAVIQFMEFKSKNKNTSTFISHEPLLDKISHENYMFESPMNNKDIEDYPVDWIIIGAKSKTTSEPEMQPKWSWVEKILFDARIANIPVYFKPNLTVRPREYPNY